ncbi:hypothetical protein QNI16_27255 [Cytophagaceae bacterium YF14B1]|uniref:Outer membrane protein beta-barrel domain-containing protein n=1 Tax=Xanthocytophaga flava TaxID=3048013 RepID=A0AAE3QVW8_9BACT|nr:hypothetical protein [Xanthocytophaga flavus]MDJ1484226.1 hypothetical protein [Xanthocytophaga flavus]
MKIHLLISAVFICFSIMKNYAQPTTSNVITFDLNTQPILLTKTIYKADVNPQVLTDDLADFLTAKVKEIVIKGLSNSVAKDKEVLMFIDKDTLFIKTQQDQITIQIDQGNKIISNSDVKNGKDLKISPLFTIAISIKDKDNKIQALKVKEVIKPVETIKGIGSKKSQKEESNIRDNSITLDLSKIKTTEPIQLTKQGFQELSAFLNRVNGKKKIILKGLDNNNLKSKKVILKIRIQSEFKVSIPLDKSQYEITISDGAISNNINSTTGDFKLDKEFDMSVQINDSNQGIEEFNEPKEIVNAKSESDPIDTEIKNPVVIENPKDPEIGNVSDQDYIDLAKQKLKKDIKKNSIVSTGDTTFLFLREDLTLFNALPKCNSQGTTYKLYILYDKNNFEEPTVQFSTIANDFIVDIGGSSSFELTESVSDGSALAFSEYTSSSIIEGVNISVSLSPKGSSETVTKKKTFTIQSCSQFYHVSLQGGFYYSTLNNPSNVNLIPKPGNPGDSTLIGDHTKSQRMLTLTAIFYPTPRNRNYRYKDLSFKEKWSICFGTAISQNLFNDLFLGLNYEFAKGGNFSAGVHYGEHKALAGYDNFTYGKSKFSGSAFDNSLMRNQWDLGFFIGVNIDFRIVNAFRASNTSQNNTKSKPTDQP